jgi:hypothetical protein
MYGPTFRFLAAIWFMCAPVAAGAAEIKINEDSAIILEGTIVPGDYDKFRKLINENCPSKSWNLLCPSVIYLASPGGNVTEAIKIGRLVRMLRLGIEVPIDDEDANLRQQSIEFAQAPESQAELFVRQRVLLHCHSRH